MRIVSGSGAGREICMGAVRNRDLPSRDEQGWSRAELVQRSDIALRVALALK